MQSAMCGMQAITASNGSTRTARGERRGAMRAFYWYKNDKGSVKRHVLRCYG